MFSFCPPLASVITVFLFNIQRILKHDLFPRALFCRSALLKHVIVPTAVSTTRRARSLCDVEGSLTSLLISIISTYRSHIRRLFDGTIRRASLEYVLVPAAVSTTRRALSPCQVEGFIDKLLISIISTYRSHIRRPFEGTIRRLYIGHTFAASE